ncbi:glutathione S-transferase [Rhizobium sp. BK313]|uniref:glutathione S-transferase family protein n=1 Tax=Rhizobium sp. BK313 TaxID=2587081 RepID=UPI0010D567F6|nr:glutathione S-transferase N-terminal domain-containing protein [Rhizobium sp. BK313]MBB3459287.1 glutathione S-transferase [Rhizobium sp. BK313]
MKLLGSLRSPYVRKVLVAAAELELLDQIDLEIHSVHLAAHVPTVMNVNPLNKIPTLITDADDVIFDSLVICEFLNELAGGDILVLKDARRRLKTLQMHALASGLVDVLIMRLVEAAKPEIRQWPEVLDATAAKINATLDYLEIRADELFAEGSTLGTLSVAVAINYIDFRFASMHWRQTRPRLNEWHAHFSTRPAIRDLPFEDTTPSLAGAVR